MSETITKAASSDAGGVKTARGDGAVDARLGDAEAAVDRFRARLQQKITAGSFELPLLPEAASQVMAAAQDQNADARRISELIHRDAALAGHVLKLANSPLYAPKVPIVSLQQAVSRLGMLKIREMALLVSCHAKVFRVPGCEARVRAIFKHSIAAAAYAREIARLRRWNVEEAFLCGLLHDAGKPVLLQTVVDVGKELGLGVEMGLVEDILDDAHAAVGGRMVTGWKLPERIGETITCHHKPEQAQSAAQTAMMTCMA